MREASTALRDPSTASPSRPVPGRELRRQDSFPGFCPLAEAVEVLATAGGIEERGAVFTRREVVDFLLDLTGYTADKPLHRLRLLEPSFGGGDFLLPAVERLLSSWNASGPKSNPVQALADCMRAVELHRGTFTETRSRLIELLKKHGLAAAEAVALSQAWLVNGDFLLADLSGEFDVVIGNPPYVRQELIPDVLLTEYRTRYTTIFDRADLYIPFIERSLLALSDGGVLGFICADRWMKNRYGGPLRKLISERFHLKIYVDMTGAPAFHADVLAYPAITVIAREHAGATRIAHQPSLDKSALRTLAQDLLSQKPPKSDGVKSIDGVACRDEPWIMDSSDQLAVIRRLEAGFPLLEKANCKVGIGVATGADKAFIGPFDELDVEDDRKLPLVMTRDIQDGTVKWRGLGVINPFTEDSGLVDLRDYPRLRRYLEERKEQISGRHCAQKTPSNWYRTIDRITPSIAETKKLLIPDIKGEAHIVYEGGKLYPHHNLYYVTSDIWDLRALQAVLLSSVTRLFIATYSTKMHGGFLRFQAQYLRRLRLPIWQDVAEPLRAELIRAAQARDIEGCNRATFKLYGLNHAEQAALGGNGE
jgi:hypothetical protein